MNEQAYSPEELLSSFALESAPVSWTPFGSGHINRTFLVSCAEGERFVLQRISDTLTDSPAELMENIVRVTAHLRAREPDPRRVLTLIPTADQSSFLSTPSGNWRMYRYVEDSFCPEGRGSEQDFYRAALAFGHFEEQLADFPAEELYEPLPDFHNTPHRFRQLHEAIRTDAAGRKGEVAREIDFLLAREETAGQLQRLRDAGELPVRVTHNDTKLNNVLFDRSSGEPLCVIDLDTVMPGLSLYDFGDAIRFGASTAAEDEKDLEKVTLDRGRYELFREGFLAACPGLSAAEKELLPTGAMVITAEQAVRFLADYLNGDRYYRIRYPEQNLDRARTQIRLLQEMERIFL